MTEPHIQLDKKGVYLIFPIDTSKGNPSTSAFTPQASINITPPEYTQSGAVGIEIFRVQSPGLSFSVFKQDCYVPELSTLDVLGATITLGKQTRIFFPKR